MALIAQERTRMSIILNERCYICNKVSSELIETHPGEYTSKSFLRDPQNHNRSMCVECKEVEEDLKLSYEAKDDPYGWKATYAAHNDNVTKSAFSPVELFDVKIDDHYPTEGEVPDQGKYEFEDIYS